MQVTWISPPTCTTAFPWVLFTEVAPAPRTATGTKEILNKIVFEQINS